MLSDALAYRYGIRRLMDISKAVEIFKNLAQEGCAEAHYELAKLYAHRSCISCLPFNSVKRDEHLFAAAQQGHRQSIIYLLSALRRTMSAYDILYYPNKKKRQFVIDEIVKVVDALIDEGDGMALLIKGVLIDDCTPQSVFYLHQAWEQGERFLSSLYLAHADREYLRQFRLSGTKKWEKQNQILLDELIARFERQYSDGNIQYLDDFLFSELGLSLISCDVLQKLKEMLNQFYIQQAERGSSDGWLQQSRLVEETLLEHLKQAAEMGNPVGAYEYSYALEQKEQLNDVQLDEIEDYYRIAAQANHPNALYEYGRYFIDENLELALQYFKRAAALDCTEAYLILSRFTKGIEQIHWSVLALQYDQLNDDHLLPRLIQAYTEGNGVKRDLERALHLQFVIDATQYYDNLLVNPLKIAIDKVEDKFQCNLHELDCQTNSES